MVCGVLEGPYAVVKSFERTLEGGVKEVGELRVPENFQEMTALVERERQERVEKRRNEHLDVREPEPGEVYAVPRYIALTWHDKSGRMTRDWLLYYASDGLLDADWERLAAEYRRAEDLQYHELVTWHSMGYFKNGGVLMY